MALTGKTIGQLTYLSGATSDTLFPVELSGNTYHVAFSGMTGNSGSSGTSGISGTSGTSGTSATAGTSGTSGNSGMAYASGFVNAGTFVQLDNIKATVTTSGNRGLSLATVSGSFSYNIGGNFAGGAVGSGGTSLAAQTLTTTPTTSIFGWGFLAQGETSTYIITNISSLLAYRITLQVNGSFLNNFISIERLY